MINMGMGGVPFDPPFTPWWDRLMNSQEQKQSVLSSDIPSSEICPPLMSISMAYYFLGVSTLCMYIRRYFSTNFNISRRLIMFPWFMGARLHKLLIENSIHEQSSRNVTNYQKITSIILTYTTSGGYPYNGVRAYMASANIYYYCWLSLYALSIPTVKFVSEQKRC